MRQQVRQIQTIQTPKLRIHGILLLMLGLLVVVGCQPADPVEQLQRTRAEYEVQASSFYVSDEPLLEAGEEPADVADGMESTEDEGDEADGSDGSDGSDGEEGEEAEVPTQQVLNLDVLVSTTASEPLDGLTIELEQQDAAGQIKSVQPIWLDVTGIQKGVSATKTIKVEGVDYEDGDGFHVSVRSPIPPGERSAYREFDGVGDGS